MKKNFIKFGILSLTLILGTTLLSACGSKEKNSEKPYSGTVLSIGSTALQPLVEKTVSGFNQKYPDVTVNVQGGGSGVGINQVAQGSAQIGNSDIPASSKIKDESILKQLVETKVCGIGFALVTTKDVGVENLTIEQIQDIFTGKTTNWNQLGGKNINITIVNRSKSSGTRAAFKNTILKENDEKEGLGITQDSTSAALKAVKETDGSVSYVALSNLMTDKDKEGVTLIKINGIEPTDKNIVDNQYPFWSYEYMITKGEPENEVKAFIDFIKSDENKGTVEKLGYIPMGNFK
ncbi:phosphate ABC transporter substrate-binding protein [Clostridium frigidicarnis]|uniref:Phosphate-binding protein n=1 Tax=Clostridium frigidicarnis TaxID=84698 RepID=A0A1I0VQN3_9CLOT|nr:phosphate ABC transporter substrate-binding protein [Clostridium frigidicarnis]SFA77986.1 phosphate ABC transporter substrate-binding protein, PhoT family [Clostridium frigidicarnis]